MEFFGYVMLDVKLLVISLVLNNFMNKYIINAFIPKYTQSGADYFEPAFLNLSYQYPWEGS